MDELRATVHDFFTETSPSARTRELMADPAVTHDPEVWRRLAGELGLLGLLAEDAPFEDVTAMGVMGVVLEEAGYVLLKSPLLSVAVVAATLLQQLPGGGEAADLRRGLAAGTDLPVLVVPAGSGAVPSAITVSARHQGDGVILDGTVPLLLDGLAATALLMPILDAADGSLSIAVVDPSERGVTRTPVATMDQTRTLATVTLAGARGRIIASDASDALSAALLAGACGVACELAGLTARCVAMATEHARTRIAFGQRIGAYQAVSHKCADMLVRSEQLASAARHAADTFSDARERAIAVPVAKVYAHRAAPWVAQANVQVHGGIGYTWEHDASLLLKRARANLPLFGDASHHRRALMAAVA